MKSSTFQYVFGLLILVMILGMVLRYGRSSHLLATDLDSLIRTFTLQGGSGTAPAYYGP